jgi:hypothetical protein
VSSGAAAAAVVLGALAAATPAQGANLAAARPCYLERVGRVAYVGAGFAPGAQVRVSLDGRPLATLTATPAGAFRGPRFRAPPAGPLQRVHRLTASDGASTAQTAFLTTTLSAELVPAGPSRSLLVRFRLRGFIPPDPAAPPPVHLHYVSPRGRPVRSQRLDPPGGPCGTVTTKPRRLFPFRPAPGTWTLQLDLRPAYARRAPPPAARLAIPVIRR